jgi:hypothetical protein
LNLEIFFLNKINVFTIQWWAFNGFLTLKLTSNR